MGRKRLKIAFDAAPLTDDHLSGIGYCEAGLVQALPRLHPEHSYGFQYFTLRHGAEKAQRLAPWLQPDTTVKAARFSPLAYRAMTSLLPVPYRLFFGGDADITHFFNYIAPPGVGGKTVVTVHDMVIRAFPETVRTRTKLLLETGLKRSMQRADRIVTDSEFSRSEIIKYYPAFADKLRVVYCGVDLKRFQPVDDPAEIARVKQAHGISGDYFLYLGTVEPRKNLVRLIEAYAKLLAQTEAPPKLVLAGGKGWLDSEIYQTVQTLQLDEQVLFTNYIPEADLRGLLCGALAFVFPSVYEGFGMPPLEAMACRVPVLASTAASLPEVTGDCAVDVDAFDPESIAEGMYRLWSDAGLRQELANRGYARAQTFTWDAAARQLYAVYEELLPGQGA